MTHTATSSTHRLPAGILTREEFDAAQRALIHAIFDDDDSARAQAEEGLYPKTLEHAEAEIENRGFLIPVGELARFATRRMLPRKRVGRNAMFSRALIDEAMQYLGESVDGRMRCRYTKEAKARLTSRHPVEKWLRDERALYPRAKENLLRIREELRCDKLLFVWQILGGDPGEVWPHRWSSGEIAQATETVRAERERIFDNFRRLVRDEKAAVE
ncbi:MAG: hypothetical protein NTU45_02635 [Planctomycetota bacterium]|jgi:hypothetical protein|nr:hypothetical protein [Planctomycetota bacterium]